MKAQEWLDSKYTVKNIKKIDSEKQELEGVLEVEGFSELEEINLSTGKGITSLTIQNCPKVRMINVNYNKITELLGIEELGDLEELRIGQNEIKSLNTDQNTKLAVFICYDNPFQDNKVSVSSGLKRFNGDGSKHSISLSTEASDKQKMSEIAEKLGIEKDDLKDKTAKEIEDLIDKKIKDNKDKLKEISDKLPGLIKEDGKVDEDKLKEIDIKDVGEIKKMKEMIREELGSKFIAQIEIKPGS